MLSPDPSGQLQFDSTDLQSLHSQETGTGTCIHEVGDPCLPGLAGPAG